MTFLFKLNMLLSLSQSFMSEVM